MLVLKTRSVESLCEFYRVLGVKFQPEQHGSGPVHFASQLGGIVMEIYPLETSAAAPDTTVRLGFVVQKLAVIMESLQSRSAEIVSKPKDSAWGMRAVVRDPDGRAVELYERRD